MIDFSKSLIFKLKDVPNTTYSSQVSRILVPHEDIIQSFQSGRDGVIFTTKRVITINTKGITGQSKDYTSIPYNQIQAFSVETAGFIDFDSELELAFSGQMRIKFDFGRGVDVVSLCKMISEFVIR